MPTVIRRSETLTLSTRRREVRGAVGWSVTQGLWSPPTDLYETVDQYVVSLEVAGMRESEFEVVFENGILFISGNRRDIMGPRAYHQMEIHYGEFSTAIALPGPVDLDHSVAEYKDGFLTVRLPRLKKTDVTIED